jgi:hypothetical protein
MAGQKKNKWVRALARTGQLLLYFLFCPSFNLDPLVFWNSVPARVSFLVLFILTAHVNLTAMPLAEGHVFLIQYPAQGMLALALGYSQKAL